MTGKRGCEAVWRWMAGCGLGIFLGFGSAGYAQTGAVATARAQSRTPVANPKVQADGDAGLTGEAALNTADIPDPTDISVEGSHVAAGAPRVWIRANTPIKVRLNAVVSSGMQRNGDTVAGVLQEPVRASNGTLLKPGTPVKATVLAAAKAGQFQSAGVLSLQVFQVGGLPVISNVLEFSGQEGKREMADANPEKGTEAMVQSGSELSFEVLGSGDRPEPEERVGGVGAGTQAGATGTVSTGQGSAAFTKPGPGSTPLTPIHGATQSTTPPR